LISIATDPFVGRSGVDCGSFRPSREKTRRVLVRFMN
jgi:hypothetical protein